MPRRETKWLRLLDEAHDAYAQCSSQEVARRRGWILSRLARQPRIAESLPVVLETLHTAQEPYLLAAASRALTRAGDPDACFAPGLLRAISTLCSRDDFVDLQHWGGVAHDDTGPTALTEAVEALVWLGKLVALDPKMLRLLAAQPGMPPEHRMTIKEVMSAQAQWACGFDDCCTFAPPPHKHFGGATVDVRGVRFENQKGAISAWTEHFIGRPCVVAFFYTRCDNPAKCSLTITKLAQVQRLLAATALQGTVQIAAISYDGDFDSPVRMRDYVQARGLQLDALCTVLRIMDGASEVRRYFGSGVNFVGTLVNWHRVEVFLLDACGKPSVAYARREWQPEEVIADLRTIVSSNSTRPWLTSLKNLTPTLWALPIALLPKCPICGATYLSASGLGALPLLDGWVMFWPVALILLSANVLLVVRTARRSGRLLPAAVAACGALLMAVPGLAFGSPTELVLGFVLVALGSVMSVVRFAPKGASHGRSRQGRANSNPPLAPADRRGR